MNATTSQPSTGDVAALSAVLAEEQRHYADLLELVRRQGQLMTSHDLEGLQDNAQRLSDGLAAADAVRLRREHLAAAVMRSTPDRPVGRLSVWLQEQSPAVRRILAPPLQAVRRGAEELSRANEMNRRLANFCLDLVEEEAALLRRCLLEDPAGCYDRGAHPATKSQGGVLQRQA